MAASAPQGVLLLEWARDYERGLLQGILRYARICGPWRFDVNPDNLQHALTAIDGAPRAGVIAEVASPRIGRVLAKSQLPALLLDTTYDSCQVKWASRLVFSAGSIAQAAAEHLLGVGVAHFALVGRHRRGWSHALQRTFALLSNAFKGTSCRLERFTAKSRSPHPLQAGIPGSTAD